MLSGRLLLWLRDDEDGVSPAMTVRALRFSRVNGSGSEVGVTGYKHGVSQSPLTSPNHHTSASTVARMSEGDSAGIGGTSLNSVDDDRRCLLIGLAVSELCDSARL